MSWSVFLLRSLGALLLAGLLLGLLVPLLVARGYELSPWIVVPVVAFTAAVLLGPPLVRGRRERQHPSVKLR